MSEPKRLLEDPEIGGLLRADLEVARHQIVDYDVEGGAERHVALIGAGVIGIVGGTVAHSTSVAPTAAAPTAAAASTATSTGALSSAAATSAAASMGSSGALSALLAKGLWVLGSIAIASAAGAGTSYYLRSTETKPPAVAAPAPRPEALRETTPESAPVYEDLDNVPATVEPSKPPPAPSADKPRTLAPKPEPGVDALEVTTYARARALASSDPAAALALLESSEKRFHGGILAEERDALAIQCLARLGREPEAKTRAETFLRAHPTSPLAERVRHDAKL